MARTGKLTSLVAEEDVKLSQRRSLSTETADKLRELILLEKLPPGMHIPERDLSEALGISRTPMREALRILEAEGLVDHTPTRRSRVANPSVEELSCLCQMPFFTSLSALLRLLNKLKIMPKACSATACLFPSAAFIACMFLEWA